MKRANKCGIQKLNNKGLSLVEVLAAVLIMALVSIVFLRSFSYAMTVNRDAQINQDALTIGQSLMEGVKAYDVKSLDKQFDTGTLTIIEQGSATKGITLDATTGNRTYTLSGLQFENHTYDAVVTLTPSSGYKTNMVTIQDFNKFNDAFFIQDPLEQDTVQADILSAVQSAGYTGSSLGDGTVTITKRTLDVDIYEDGGADKVVVKSIYEYKASGFKKPDPLNSLLTVTIPTVTGTVNIPQYDVYDNSATKSSGAELQNIYLYYYPAYMSAPSDMLDCENDYIDINNQCTTVDNIYLMKQMYPTMLNALGTPTSDMENGEASYLSSHVTVAASTVTVDSTSGKPNFYCNVNQSLTGNGSPNYTNSISDYEGPFLPWDETTAASDPLIEEVPYMYDVVVKVTNAATGETECQLLGSCNYRRELK